MVVHRLLYRSEVAISGPADEVEARILDLVERSRATNEPAGITGALMIASGVFIQALEGPLPAIEATFERICRDLRHRRVRLLELVEREERVFSEWSLAQVRPTRELAALCSPLEAVPQRLAADAPLREVVNMMRTLLTIESAASAAASRARPKPATNCAIG